VRCGFVGTAVDRAAAFGHRDIARCAMKQQMLVVTLDRLWAGKDRSLRHHHPNAKLMLQRCGIELELLPGEAPGVRPTQ